MVVVIVECIMVIIVRWSSVAFAPTDALSDEQRDSCGRLERWRGDSLVDDAHFAFI
jgi:hypothetical protein